MGPPQARSPEHGPRVGLSASSEPAYDRIGIGYTRYRRPDPRIAGRIHASLGDAGTVLNVGAGAGAYEPADRPVVALEPSRTMLDQRSADAAPAVQGVAERLPFPDLAFDAAMGVLTIHHWTDVDRGLAELRRVARRQVVLTFELEQQGALWFAREYLPESLGVDAQAPTVSDIVDRLGGAQVVAVPVPHDCSDGFFGAYWRRPEAYLDPEVRASISTFSLVAPEAVDAAVGRLREDLESGAWHRRFGALLELDELDLGYRVVVTG